jgi:hypothetical protein
MRNRLILSIALFLCTLGLFAQDFEIVSVESLPADMSAREEMKTDHNDRQCALLRVATQNIAPNMREGFSFVPDLGSEVVERATRDGEIWLWVSPGIKYLRIKHRDWGQYELRLQDYVTRVEALHTYKITVRGTLSLALQEQGNNMLTQQYLAFQINPTDAILEVNGKTWQVEPDGSAIEYVPFGKYDYQVSLANYHTYTGFVVVDDPENTHKVEVNLLPNFGWIEVSGDGLEDASVYIDNALAGKVPFKSKALKSGQYNIRIVKKMYNDYSDVVTVKDNETTRLSPSLKADFAGITLKVDADAEIWVNNEKKGTRTWTGPLSSGTYKIECKQANHETTMITKEITPQMAGQTIKLDPPRPIYGSLDVVSTPNFATLYIDGKEIGETPKFIKELLIGAHELRLTKKGCAPIQKNIVIEKGETLEVKETLATGKSVTVKTDRAGDKVYVDNTFVGETPITTSVGFGQHTIKVTRNNVPVEKTITIAEQDSDKELLFEFGRLITIKTDQDGDAVFVDSNKVGVSPLSIDLPLGKHTIRAERKKKFDEMDIHLSANDFRNQFTLTLHGETPSHFVENGVNFATLDFAYSPAPQTSYGATFGSVKKIGWFVSAASNFNFNAMKADLTADDDGLVNGEFPDYTGENCSTRISVMGGLLVKVAGPLCLRVGAGYGTRVKSWYTFDDHLVKYSGDSYSGLDATAGLQLNMKGFTICVDAVTTNFKTLETKAGLGYCWKRKN